MHSSSNDIVVFDEKGSEGFYLACSFEEVPLQKKKKEKTQTQQKKKKKKKNPLCPAAAR